MKFKVFIALLLCVTVFTAFGAGGRQGGTSAGSSSAEDRSLSLCMSQIRYGYSADDAMMQAWVEVIEKATNTKITIDALPHNNMNEFLNVRFASGDYADIIRPQQSWDMVSQYGMRGYIQPVTQYINNDPRFAPVKGIDLPYKANNEIFGIPTDAGNNKIIWFRKDMADKYGLKLGDSMTTSEFVTELRKINKNEVIPFSFPMFIVNFQIFYNFFGAWAGIKQDASGQYIDGMQTNEMKEAILWVKSLYDEGLMDREFITNDNNIMREKVFSGRAASSIDYTYRYTFLVNSSVTANASTDFIPVYTLKGPRGDFGNLNESYGEAMTLSVKNRNVPASMDIIYWLFFTPEGRKLDALSVEGVHYDIVNRSLVPRPAAVAAGYAIEHQRLSSSWAQVPYQTLGFSFEGMSDSVMENLLKYSAISNSQQYMGPMIKIPMGIAPLYDENIASYIANEEEMATKIVLGTQTIDQAYADYARFWASIRGDEMLRQLNSSRR